MNYENDMTSTKPMTRSESLTEAFKNFMEADHRLYEARINETRLQNELNIARAQLSDAEQWWTKQSELLAKELMSAAPASSKAQMPTQAEDYNRVQAGQCEAKVSRAISPGQPSRW